MEKINRKINWIKYIIVLIITISIFATAILVSNKLTNKKIDTVQNMEDRMFIDILSLETQFDLLEDLACENITENSMLSQQLKDISEKLAYMEESLGVKDLEVIKLKRRYSLLQIKDILLMKKISKKCDLNPIFILYFYSNDKEECIDCKKQGYVLTKIAKDYPNLRIYSFDYNLDLSVLKTLITSKNIQDKKGILPILLLEDETFYGFTSIEKLSKLLPEIEKEIKEEEILKEDENEKK